MGAPNGTRELVLKAVFDGHLTRAEIIQATGLQPDPVSYSLRESANLGLLERVRDPYGAGLCYRLTLAGKSWLNGDRKKAGRPARAKAPDKPVDEPKKKCCGTGECCSQKGNQYQALFEKLRDNIQALEADNARLRQELSNFGWEDAA